MKHPHQLEFFEESSEVECLRHEVAALRRELDKQRRGALSRHNALCKLCLTLQEENGQLAKRLAALEKAQQLEQQNSADEDYLVKLFAQAYLN